MASEIVNDIIGFAFSTGGAIIAMLLAALWSRIRPRSNAARRFLITAALAYSLASIYGVSVLSSRLLTSGYRQFSLADVSPQRTVLVVLGESSSTVQGWRPELLSVPRVIEAARVLEAFRVYRLVDPALVISSSGPPSAPAGAEPDSVVMRDVLVRLGVPASRILLESKSRNTHEQAVLVGSMLRSLNIEQVILVTSDVHMPRAMGTFRAQGWNAVPAIAPDPYRTEPWRTWIVPSHIGLSLSGSIVHEVLGIGYYWMRDRWRP